MSVLPVVLDTLSRVPSLWEFVGTCIGPGELRTSVVKTSPFTVLKCRKSTYLSKNLDENTRYACFYNHYLAIHERVSEQAFHSMTFGKVALYKIGTPNADYKITIQISHDPIDEGEFSLLFWANDTALYTLSFTIVPGYAVGLDDRHTLLISRMQGSRAKFQELRTATKDINEISPQAILLAALEGIAEAMSVQHLAGVPAAQQAAYNDRTAEILTRIYDDFYRTAGAESVATGFHITNVPLPRKSLTLVKPGHRLRTKLKQKIKSDIAASVRESWQSILCARDGDAAQDEPMTPARAWFQTGSRADELHRHFSASPSEGRDWPRTELLAEQLRARFPDAPAGYQVGTVALREMYRLDEARTVAAEAMARFPNEAWPVAEAAWVARALGDTGETIRLTAELRQRLPNDPAGYQIGAVALREMSRFDEAASVAAEAMVRFPAEGWAIAEAAWAARALGDPEAAVPLAAELRRRLPDNPAGYQIGAAALRETHRLDESAAVAAEGIVRFPTDAWPLSAAAWTARASGEAEHALRLAAELRLRFPEDPAGYQIGAAGLRERHRLNEASAIAAEAMARFPADAWPLAEAAWIAKALGDDGEAARLATELRSRFPDNPAGHQILQTIPSMVGFEP